MTTRTGRLFGSKSGFGVTAAGFRARISARNSDSRQVQRQVPGTAIRGRVQVQRRPSGAVGSVRENAEVTSGSFAERLREPWRSIVSMKRQSPTRPDPSIVGLTQDDMCCDCLGEVVRASDERYGASSCHPEEGSSRRQIRSTRPKAWLRTSLGGDSWERDTLLQVPRGFHSGGWAERSNVQLENVKIPGEGGREFNIQNSTLNRDGG